MGISQARRSFVRRSDFWSFNLANWPPRQTDSQTVSPPHPRPLLLLAARAHSPPSQPLYGLLPNLLFFSPCVTSLHPSVTVLSSLILEFFFVFIYLFILKRPPAAQGSLSGHTAHALNLPHGLLSE